MLPLVLALLGVLSPALAKVEVMQYGQYGGLTLVCGRGELILVESEQLGYSETDGECRPRPMCSVPYTLARWYCRGKSTCTGMQVERRPLHKRTCGSDFTNCLRVEYQCIKKKKLVDVCDNVYYKIPKGQGYLSSPGFPEMYPPQQNCTCSLTAENDDFIQVSTPFFLLKSTKPCNDWLKLRFDGGKEEKKCGYVPEMGPYVGREIDINFRSDRSRQDMGFWLMYKAVESNDVILRCGKYAQETPKKKRTKAKTTKAISTTKTTTISTTTTTPATSTSTTTPTTTASTTTMATRAMKKFAKELPEQRRKVKPTLSDLFRKSSPVKTFRDKFSKVGKRKIVREPEEPTQSRSPWGSTETDTPWFFSGRKAGPNMQPTEATVKEYVPSPVKKVYRESQTYRPPPIEELMKDMGLRQKVYRPPPVETLVKTTTTMASTKAPIPTAPSEPKQAVVPSKDEFEPPVPDIKMPAIQEHYLPPPMFKAAEPQPPVQKYQPPVEEYQPPLQKYQPPVEEYNPPVPEFKPSINEFNQPMSDFKSPVNEFKPAANEFKPQPMKGFKIPDQNYKPEEYMPPLPEYHPPMPAYKPPPPEELFRDQLIPTEIQIEQQEEETVGVINGVSLDNYLTPEKEQAFDSFAKETTTMEVPIVTDPVQVTEESQATTVSDVVVNDAEPPMIPWNQQLPDGKVQPVLEKEKVAVEEGIKGFPGVPVSSYDEEWGMWGMPVGPKDGPTDELANNIGNYASNYYNYDEYYNGELNPRVETIPKQPSTSAPTDTTTPKAVENVDFMMTKKEKNDLTPPWDEFPQNFFSAMKAPSDMAPEGEMPPPVQEDDMMYVPPLEELIPIESFGSRLDQDPYGVLNEEMSADDGMDGFFSFGDEVPVGQLFGEELETVPQPKAINDLFPGLMAWNAKEGLKEGPVEPMGLQEAETSSTTTTESTTSSTTTSTTTTLPTTTLPTTTPTTTTASTTSTTTTQATTTTTLPTTTTTTLPTTIRTTTITPTTSTTVPTSTVTPTTSTTIPTTTTTDSTTTTPTTTTTATTTITTTTEAEEADVFGMILGEENIGLTLPEDANQIESNLLLADSGVGEPELIQLQPEEQPLLEPVYFWGDEGVIGGLDMDTTPTSIDSLFPDAMVTGRLEPVNNVNLHDDSIDWVLGPVVEDTFPETSTDEVVTEDPWGPATNSPWDHEERETTRKWWEIPTMPEHPFKGTHIREYPDVPVITEVEEDIVGVVGKEGMPVELPDNLRELDPEIYMKIKDYISSNQRVSQPSQISQSYDNAMANNIAEKSSPHTFWVLIAVGIIGWMVFLVMVGLLIYYRREKARPTRRMKPYSSPHSTIPSHLMFPSLSNLSASPTLTIPSSAGSLGAEINARAYGMDEFPHNAIRPGHREVPIDVPFEYMGYPVQPSPRPSMGDAATTVCHSPIPSSSVSTMIGVGGMEDRPLPPIPHPIGRDVTEGTQTRDETNACTQTDKNSSTQTDNGTVRSNASTASYESLTKFDKRTPIKRKSSPGSCSEDDTNATYSSIDTLMKKADNANRKSFRSLNSTNISSWVFSTMNKAAANLSPKKEKNKDKIKNKKSKKHQQPEISSPMPLQTPTGVTALKSYPQVSTPFLSVKDKQKVEQLPGQGENVGLTEWKSVSTLNTEHSGDSEAIYNQLNKIAMVYNDLPSQDGESLSEASTSSPESSPNMFHRDFKIPPPVPPKSPYIHMSRSSEQLNTIKEDSEKEDGGSVKERSKIFTMINV